MENIDQSLVLCTKLGVVVNFGIIESEHTIALSKLHIEVWIASQDLKIEGTIFVGRSHIFDFVNDCADTWSFIE